MLTRLELAYAAWYILLFTLVVGWAALRPALHSIPLEPIVSENRVRSQLDVTEHEPEMRRITQRTVR